MGQKQTGRYCGPCGARTLAIGTTPNHVLHLALAFLSGGLWLPVWLLATLGKIGGYRCSKCGGKV